MNHTLRLILLALAFAPALAAQTFFLDVTPPADPYFVTPEEEDFWVNAVAPADVDGDGDTDLAVLGFHVVYFQSVEDRLVLLINEGPDAGGAWLFSHQLVPLGSLVAGGSDLAWGDYDGDGDHDLAVGSEGATVVYRNDAGTLTALPNALPGYAEDSSYTGAYDLRSLSWADADNDSDLDLLVPSVYNPDLFAFETKLVTNGGPDGAGGWLWSEAAVALDPTQHAQSGWADDDGDGDLDLFLVNVDPYTESGFIRRYANDAGAFTGTDLLALRVEYGLADWGDYDADGDLDLLVAGNVQEGDGTFHTILRVYRNDAGVYTEITLVEAPNADWLDLHAATWADYDSDGDVDLLVTGNYVGDGEIVGRSKVFANEGGVFAPLALDLPAPVSSVGRGGSFTWFDVDGDADLDYLVAGAYYVPNGNGLVEAKMHLYRNGAPAANAAPSAPTGLSATATADGAVLAWSPAADDGTPTAALTYELEVRRVGGPAKSAPPLPQPGNLSAVSSWALQGLAPGTYAWSVCAVDSAFTSGPQAQGTFTVGSGAAIFADGFESGDTSAWGLTVSP
ncbi:MAG TPA: VCBS repeat-containing protein [Thermoanaerobaculia bacterium]|nr:VCBS repeat-containing protein [Thermoanaerobaculia bacterium]